MFTHPLEIMSDRLNGSESGMRAICDRQEKSTSARPPSFPVGRCENLTGQKGEDYRDAMRFSAMNPSRGKPSSSSKGFSLIELLTVITIIAVLAVLAMSAFTAIGRAGNLTKTGNDIAGLLEQARSHAMARNTYVWVGFHEGTEDTLMVAVVSSRNGTKNPPVGDIVPLSPIKRFPRIKMVVLPEDTPPRGTEEESVAQLASVEAAVFPFVAGPEHTAFNQRVIQFNNRGESRIVADELYKVVEMGLQTAIDGEVREPKNWVAVHVGGLTGSVSIYRP